MICPCPKGLVNVNIYFELKTFFLGLLFRLLMILCVVLFPLKMHMLPPSNDPCIIFSLKNVCLSSKYAIFIFIRDLCPKLDTQPAGQNNARQGSRHLDNLSDRCRRAAAAGVIYGYVSVWLFCDIVPATRCSNENVSVCHPTI